VAGIFILPQIILDDGKNKLSAPVKILLMFFFLLLLLFNFFVVNKKDSDKTFFEDESTDDVSFDKKTPIQKFFDRNAEHLDIHFTNKNDPRLYFLLVLISFIAVMIIVALIVK
jgi:Ca2+/Na+ antiporter